MATRAGVSLLKPPRKEGREKEVLSQAVAAMRRQTRGQVCGWARMFFLEVGATR